MRAPALLLGLALLAPSSAHAFCGFYVSGATSDLYNNATLVVLMRDGTRTVLSMQNNYQGPPQDFALVVPVPQVLKKENVRTLPRDVFQRVDQLAAPRLVEYWEGDPCKEWPMPPMMSAMLGGGMPMEEGAAHGVKVEARFEVGEYDIVVLSANDSSGLETWLHQENYNIPQGASAVLAPYVASGTKFFVAKVDVDRVSFVDGQAVLSPLRVHYDSDTFALPVRLGLLNSHGEQDLLVHILAKDRYQVANYDNAFIPTNLKINDKAKDSFGSFYDSLFREVAGRGRVVTEYSWSASSCDPCPTQPLDETELATLGGDVIKGLDAYQTVLTRLHYRYTRDTLGEDLVFERADPIVGGRGMPDQQGNIGEKKPGPSQYNQFQGRYVMLHPWTGAVSCDNPERGRWGGPDGTPPWASWTPTPQAAPSQMSAPARSTAPIAYGQGLAEDVPELGLVRSAAAATPHSGSSTIPEVGGDTIPELQDAAPAQPAAEAPKAKDGPCSTAPGSAGWLGAALALSALWRRRR